MTDRASELAQAEQIDAVCDRFEQDVRDGNRPRIEDLLSDTSASLRPVLLHSLIALEIELRQKQGEHPQFEEYSQRFPADEEVVTRAFSDLVSVLSSVKATMADTSRGGTPALASASLQEPLKELGRFQILSLLGEGAFGTVYQAHDPQLDRLVAIKVPRADALQSPEDRDRFLREARSAAGLQHPQICPVHEVGTIAGRDYIVMAYIDGKPLSKVLQSQPHLSDKQIVNVIRKVARGLQEAHEKGVVHRDLKPANIMINRKGEPVIMDFGLARRAKATDPEISRSGQILGTPAYMSPEQARGGGKSVGPAADIYSLGVILYELLCGRRPFEGTVTEVIGQILHVDVTPPSSHLTGVNPKLEAICLKAIAKNPADRYASMKQLAGELEDFLRSGSTMKTLAAAIVEETPAFETKQIERIFEAVSSDSQEKVELAVQRHGGPPKIPWRTVWIASGLAGAMLLFGIIFFIRSGDTTIIVNIPLPAGVDLADESLTFFLDEKPINTEALSKPVELQPGSHELVIFRGESELKRRSLFASATDWRNPLKVTKDSDEAAVVPKNRELATAPKVTGTRRKPISELNTTGFDALPWLSVDGRRIYWQLRKPDTEIEDPFWIYMAERADARSPFERKQQVLPGRQPTLTGDELEMVFVRGRPGASTLRFAARKSTRDPFEASGFIPELRDQSNPNSPFLSQDGLMLVFQRGQVENNTIQIVSCTRSDRQSPWSAPEVLLILSDPTWTEPLSWPFLSRDGLTLWYCHGSSQAPEIRIATRPDRNSPFANHQPVVVEGTPLVGRAPRFVEATGELFYSQNVTQQQGDWSLWVVKDYAAAHAVSQSPFDEWFNLFNGQDLAGWEPHPKDTAEWEVKDGVVAYRGGAPSHLFTLRDDYGDFHLRGEVRLDVPENSGIWFWCEPGTTYPHGFEVDLNSAERGQIGSVLRFNAPGWKEAFVEPKDRGVRSGQWFSVEIIVRNGGIQTVVNGQPVIDAVLPKQYRSRGRLALQSNVGERVEFRNLKIREIADEPRAAAIESERAIAEWILSHGGAVRVATESDLPTTLTDYMQRPYLSRLDQLPAGDWHVIGITLDPQAATDVNVARLASLKHLKLLWILGPSLTDTGLTYLSTHRELVALKTESPHLTDAGFQHLQSLSELEELDVRGSKLTDAGLKSFAKMPCLFRLDVSGTPVVGTGLADLRTAPSLRHLHLNGCQNLTDDALQHAMALKWPVSLHLNGTPITDAGIKHLARISSLKNLELRSTKITGACLDELAKLPDLGYLMVNDTSIGDTDAAKLPQLKSLTALHMMECPIGDDGLKAIGGMHNLRHLVLNATKLTDAGIAHLEPLQKLEMLWLWETKLTDAAVDSLGKLKSVGHLDIGKTLMTPAGQVRLQKLLPATSITPRLPADRAAAEWVLSMNGWLKIRLDGEERPIHRSDELPERGFEISEISLVANQDSAINDGLGVLRELKGLRTLNLTNSHVNDAGVAKLSGMTWLTTLHLHDCPVTDACLDSVSTLTGLQKLYLHYRPLTDAGMAKLVPLHHLRELVVIRSKVTNAGLRSIAQLPNLQRLNLGGTLIDDDGLRELQALKQIESLALDGTRIRGAGIRHLMPLDKLTELFLGDGLYAGPGELTDDGLVAAAELRTLKKLGVADDRSLRLTDAGVTPLFHLDQLQDLHLHLPRLTDVGLASVAKLNQLEILGIRSRSMTDEGVNHLRTLDKLWLLRLHGEQLTDDCLPAISALWRLKHLDLVDCRIAGSKLDSLSNLAQLEGLHLTRNPVVDVSLKHVARIRDLKLLILQATKVTDRGLEFLHDAKSLREIQVGNSPVTKAGLTALQRALPNCSISPKPESAP